MRDWPTGRLWRRMTALGLLAGLGLGVWHLAISPVWQEIRATETALAKAHAREAGLNTRISRLKAALAAPQAGPVALPLWSGPSDGARAARIQGAVQALARGHEIALRAVSARGDRIFHERPAIGPGITRIEPGRARGSARRRSAPGCLGSRSVPRSSA